MIHDYYLDLQCQMTKYLESTAGCQMYIFKYSNSSFYKHEIVELCITSFKTVIISGYNEFIHLKHNRLTLSHLHCNLSHYKTANESAPVLIAFLHIFKIGLFLSLYSINSILFKLIIIINTYM